MQQQPLSTPIIAPTEPQQRAEALSLLRLDETQIGQLLAAEAAGHINMDGLFLARHGTSVVGAAWGQTLAGQAAFCWPATIRSGESERTAEALQNAVDAHLDREGILTTQALIRSRDIVHAVRLKRAGYRLLTDLDYLACPLAQLSEFPVASPELTFVRAGRSPELKQVVERTYIESLDCTELDEQRSVQQILEGYVRTGRFRPDWWIIAENNGDAVGCALVADHSDLNDCELMYVGVIPEMRGRGWGAELIKQVGTLARVAGRERMILAVDNGNWPAQAMYQALGFVHWDRRSVYVRTVHENGIGTPSPKPN